jgi:hypothetical protein
MKPLKMGRLCCERAMQDRRAKVRAKGHDMGKIVGSTRGRAERDLRPKAKVIALARGGSAGRIRTYDQPVNSRLLYH